MGIVAALVATAALGLQAPTLLAARAPVAPHPPQFVVVSFDGGGGPTMWRYWRSVGRRSHAHFTFFLSGVYLVDWDHHELYDPPRGPGGSSAIGFAPNRAWIDATLRQIDLGYRDGHELATHYNGHFCGSGGVGTWSQRDWAHELDQFEALTRRAHLPFGDGAIAGARTPCLEGNLRALYPLLRRRGFRYDASGLARLGTWPRRVDGIWSVPLLELPFPGHTYRVVSMDYNFYANDAREDETYRALWNAFRTSYRGNRAPLSIGVHFEDWNGGAYDRAITRLVENACRLPDVRCVSFRELVDWLDLYRA